MSETTDALSAAPLPELIADEGEAWFAALVPTKAEAIALLVDRVGFGPDGMDEVVQECRLQRAPVPDGYEDEYSEWFEKHPDGDIVAWEIRP